MKPRNLVECAFSRWNGTCRVRYLGGAVYDVEWRSRQGESRRVELNLQDPVLRRMIMGFIAALPVAARPNIGQFLSLLPGSSALPVVPRPSHKSTGDIAHFSEALDSFVLNRGTYIDGQEVAIGKEEEVIGEPSVSVPVDDIVESSCTSIPVPAITDMNYQ
ncbi:unnamed protein product, partial [Mesorhabditis spiculigera]